MGQHRALETITAADLLNAGACHEGVRLRVVRMRGRIEAPTEEALTLLAGDDEARGWVECASARYGYGYGDGYGYGYGSGYGYGDGDGDGSGYGDGGDPL